MWLYNYVNVSRTLWKIIISEKNRSQLKDLIYRDNRNVIVLICCNDAIKIGNELIVASLKLGGYSSMEFNSLLGDDYFAEYDYR
jgi:hypothetical protein